MKLAIYLTLVISSFTAGLTARAGISPKFNVRCLVKNIKHDQITLKCGDPSDNLRSIVSRNQLLELNKNLKDKDIRPDHTISLSVTGDQFANLLSSSKH